VVVPPAYLNIVYIPLPNIRKRDVSFLWYILLGRSSCEKYSLGPANNITELELEPITSHTDKLYLISFLEFSEDLGVRRRCETDIDSGLVDLEESHIEYWSTRYISTLRRCINISSYLRTAIFDICLRCSESPGSQESS
jgi:hypothetical protein